MSRWKSAQPLALCVVSGGVVDFLVNGVLKILWIPIYGPVYISISLAIYNYILRSRRSSFALKGAISFLIGAAIGHLVLTGRKEVRVYPMNLTNDNPISLRSPSFSQSLLITSDKVRNAIGDRKSDIPVTIQIVKDFGCIQSFKVATVAGVDVMFDTSADWVWRDEKIVSVPSGGFSGMDEENLKLLWCRIRWF
jgi:hypothetical protein